MRAAPASAGMRRMGSPTPARAREAPTRSPSRHQDIGRLPRAMHCSRAVEVAVRSARRRSAGPSRDSPRRPRCTASPGADGAASWSASRDRPHDVDPRARERARAPSAPARAPAASARRRERPSCTSVSARRPAIPSAVRQPSASVPDPRVQERDVVVERQFRTACSRAARSNPSSPPRAIVTSIHRRDGAILDTRDDSASTRASTTASSGASTLCSSAMPSLGVDRAAANGRGRCIDPTLVDGQASGTAFHVRFKISRIV